VLAVNTWDTAPDRDTALVDVVETETVTETRRLRQDVETIWGDPYGAAHDIRQDYVTRLTLREPVLRETLTQVYENREAALEGWDAEIGLRLPVLEDVVQPRGCLRATSISTNTVRRALTRRAGRGGWKCGRWRDGCCWMRRCLRIAN
jgi:hypothetical protein